jgi:hypothetical protein
MGETLPPLKADIVTLCGEGEIAEVAGDPRVLDWPGEFEVKGISIESFHPNGDETNAFLFQVEGIHICHLGYLSHEISDEVLERIGDVDILLVPVGGGLVLDGKTAQKVVESIEPRIVMFRLRNSLLRVGQTCLRGLWSLCCWSRNFRPPPNIPSLNGTRFCLCKA